MDSKQVKSAAPAEKPRRKPPAAGKGRKKGTPNKITATLKEAILQAAENAGGVKGTVGYLEKQAKENPQVFMPLLGKVLPMQVQHEGAIRIERVDVKFVGDE
ncbi:hypothetical protein [Paracoccus homiensis]|uniref:Uncharacterized protein n=1 Tax=Paracoccus homiensis TaxID=364199 RepID=A0A1I0GY13_9RHOB|nr:hypothetical protein [Paracoccus homiensis]SET75380.1 hypothetical protein SAMN04489858_109111 [Paracoccus homiensis]